MALTIEKNVLFYNITILFECCKLATLKQGSGDRQVWETIGDMLWWQWLIDVDRINFGDFWQCNKSVINIMIDVSDWSVRVSDSEIKFCLVLVQASPRFLSYGKYLALVRSFIPGRVGPGFQKNAWENSPKLANFNQRFKSTQKWMQE